jgi:hypothetical protein
MKNQLLVLALAGLSVAVPSVAAGQNVPDPSETARFHLGPLSLTPKLGVRDLGVDTNVFNLSQTPERDLTATFSAGTDAWFRLGRAYFASRTVADWRYFQKSSSQRSVDLTQEGRVDLDLLRFVPRAGGGVVNSRQRPNDEFDLRVQQRNTAAFAGVMVPVGSRGQLDLEFRRQEYDYGSGKFGDADVASALNRTSETAAVMAGFEVTPLTRLVLRADVRKDRFEFSEKRNSDSVKVTPGVEFEASALISGHAYAGYRQFTSPSVEVPDVKGFVAAVELKFVAADTFRVTGQLKRDLDYSLDLDETVYVSTLAGVDVLQALGLDWDVVGRLRRGSLAYQQIGPTPGRVDRVWQTGVGVGRRIGTEFRLGFDVDFVNRSSDRLDRAYDGVRYGASVTYGY